jgi:phosphoribosyl-AMP cyclohydrolase
MNLEPAMFFAIIGISFASTALIIMVLFLIRRRTLKRMATFGQATEDLQADFRRLRNETNRRIAELETTINKLKVECAAANIQLLSLKDQTRQTSEAQNVSPGQEDTWVRGKNSGKVSIVPAILESADNDTWLREGNEAKAIETTNRRAMRTTALSKGNTNATR